MRFYYDHEKVEELNQKLTDYFFAHQQDRRTVHLSDTCHCELKAYNRLTNLPHVIDSSGVGPMLFGDAGQILLQRLYPEEQIEYEVEASIVPCHIDIFEDEEYVLEIKWSAARIFRASDVPQSWEDQLKKYMALTNTKIGWMIIVNIFSRQLTAFKMVLVQDELDKLMEEIRESKERILNGAEKKNPLGLVIIDTECPYCSYRPTRKKKKAGIESCEFYTTKKYSVGRKIVEKFQAKL